MKAVASEDRDAPQPARFSLLVGLKLDDASTYAAEEAIRIAQRIPRCQLHLVHVVEDDPSERKTRELAGHLGLYVNEKARYLGGLADMTVGVHVRAGEPAAVLASFAQEVKADLLIVGSAAPHRASWYRTAKVERIVAAVSCPVVVAGPKRSLDPEAQDDAREPRIEPPCPDCLLTRQSTHGAAWWCPQHIHAAVHGHAFSYQRELPLRSPEAIFPVRL